MRYLSQRERVSVGVTIHFEGTLKNTAAYEQLLKTTRTYAQSRTWLTEPIEPAVKKLLRVRRQNEEKWDYVGPVTGAIVYIHEDCDPVRLEFDKDLYLQEFVKTQFAGPEVHKRVVEFLRSIEPFFEEFYVEDEGEYWKTGDLEALSRHIDNCNVMIEEEMKKSPKWRSKVRTPEGRILDLIS